MEADQQKKRRRSSRGVARDASNSAYETPKGWDLRTLPESEQLAAVDGDWWKVTPCPARKSKRPRSPTSSWTG